jgi:Domain of unknown function (DUF1704)
MESLRRNENSQAEALDEAFIDQFERVKVTTADLTPDNVMEVKQQFFSDTSQSPVFTYEKNKKYRYDEREIILLDLKNEMSVRGDIPDAVKRLYLWSINEKIAKIRMLREVQMMAKDQNKDLHMMRFQRYAEYMYGVADLEIFNESLERMYGVIATNVSLEANKTSYLALSTEFPDSAYSTVLEPAIEAVNNNESPAIVDAAELKVIFEDALAHYNLNGWKVVVDKKGSRKNITVNPAKNEIRLPSSQHLQLRSGNMRLTNEKIQGLIAHEIGTHVTRFARGGTSRLRLLKLGLDRYISGEEGIAGHRENQFTGSDATGHLTYLAYGLAKGLDGHKPRTFSEVFAIMKHYSVLRDSSSEAVAKEKAWNVCLNIFSGTPAHMPGVVFGKDLIYREGYLNTVSLMSKENQIDIDFGKFDPTNDRHVCALVEIGFPDELLTLLEA